ncbi:DDE-type integrase/transposase/recombinase [Mesorhizobium sp. WSM4976]|uniref:DDE-type integrase/transposase/recombinase n=1 Tax=Mesorhizobium sp. WSM4976 TaxID=3038549 RepID=UPI0032422ECD
MICSSVNRFRFICPSFNRGRTLTPGGGKTQWQVTIILDAWSRLVVGYAIGRSIDARLTVAALKMAIAHRRPPPGCIHLSDRGANTQRRSIDRFWVTPI